MNKPTYKLLLAGLLLILVGCGQSATDPDEASTTPSAETTAPTVVDAETESTATTKFETADPSETADVPSRPSPVALAKQDCGQLTTQLEMNQCAAENYSISDKALNQVYQEIRQQLGDVNKARLTTAEERWLVFRDAQCQFESSRFEGGSIAPLVQASCMEQITDNRIAELQQTEQTASSYAAIDAELNEVYQAVQALANNSQSEALTDVQLAWLDYRDAHCEYEVNVSAQADATACLALITETRVFQLQVLEEAWSL